MCKKNILLIHIESVATLLVSTKYELADSRRIVTSLYSSKARYRNHEFRLKMSRVLVTLYERPLNRHDAREPHIVMLS
jgi:hypothetical protein